MTAGMSLLTMKIIKKIGYICLLATSYAGLVLFLVAHLYPSIYTLLPAYLLLGATLGPAWISKWNLVVFFASRISCGQNECSNNASTIDGLEDHKMYCNRDERVRRLARWYHAAENLGIVLGAIIASLVMTSCATTNDVGCFYHNNISPPPSNSIMTKDLFTTTDNTSSVDLQNISLSSRYNITPTTITTTKSSLSSSSSSSSVVVVVVVTETNTVLLKTTSKGTSSSKTQTTTVGSPFTYDGGESMITGLTDAQNGTIAKKEKEYNYDMYIEPTMSPSSDQLMDSMFNTNEHGDRICGADSCPVSIYYATEFNYSKSISQLNTHPGTIPLIIIYIILGLIALILTCLSQQIDNSFKCDTVKGMTDTLLFAGPMAYFIGTEQGYVLGDFTKVC